MEIKIECPEGYEIDSFNKDSKLITFKKIESKYPLSVKEIPNRNQYIHNEKVLALLPHKTKQKPLN